MTRTSDFFDSYASDFNAIYGNNNNIFNRFINKLFRKSMMLRFKKTCEGCFPIEGKKVIDIGCGPGHYSVALARAGASEVVGVDFAPSMIALSNKNAADAGVADKCKFLVGDFLKINIDGLFDYAVVMGLMDYIAEPREFLDKVLAITSSKAFFSFPVGRGFLAWQRKLRYKSRCELYMYTRDSLEEIFSGARYSHITIEQIGRDFFVAVDVGCEPEG
jgi:2-polyprenyl-3-methyl-5-hydroxy-6-metoxy-1,4-benzoquinol methylase